MLSILTIYVLLVMTLLRVSLGDVISDASILVNPDLDVLNIWDALGVAIRGTWTVERLNIWNEALVVSGGQPDTRVVVSDGKLTDEWYLTILDAWENHRQEFEYLKLSCLSSADRRCICANFSRTNSTDVWKNIGVDRCDDTLRIPEETFSGFSAVKTLAVTDTVLPDLDRGVFSHLAGTEVVMLQNVLLSQSSVESVGNSLCSGRLVNLVGLYMANVSLTDSDSQNSILRMFDCGVPRYAANASNVGDRIRHSLNAIIISANICNISSLTRTSFSSVNPTSLLSLDLSHNVISIIDGDTFDDFVNLLELILTDNRLTQLSPTLLSGLQSLRYLDVAGNLLESFDASLFPNSSNLNMLNLRENRLRSLGGRFSVARKLVYVYLDNNVLGTVRRETFQNCTTLMVLNMHNNSINTVDEYAFQGLPHMIHLNISNNRISDSFELRSTINNSGMNFLTSLDLSGNNISYLWPDSFATNSSQFGNLSLANNSISVIDRHAFRGLTTLIILLLNNNKLLTLNDEFIFRDLVSLQYLDLSGNRLPYLLPSTFLTNGQLTMLDLSNNIIGRLPDNLTLPDTMEHLLLENNRLTDIPLFAQTLPKLEVLHVGRNWLTNISRYQMSRFPKLAQLFLERNFLTSLPAGVFADNDKLTTLTLHENQLELNFSVDYFGEPGSSLYRPRLHLLTLDNNRIRSTKDLLLHPAFCNVLRLHLSNNPLGTFGEQKAVRCLVMTTHIYMRNCALTTISDTALESPPYVEILDLGDNLLTEFKPLKTHSQRITVLLDSNPILCSCRMKWLKDEAYSTHYNATECYHAVTGELRRFETVPVSEFLCKIDGHCLTEVKECDCYAEDETNLDHPSHLICSSRRLNEFPTRIQPSMKVIYFDKNNLTRFSTIYLIPPRVSMRELYLDFNHLATLDDDAFTNFPNLEVIGLSGNRLSRLTGSLFASLTRLRELFLHDNRISVIEPGTFRSLSLVTRLSLHSNELAEVNDSTLSELGLLHFLRNISIHDNPWSCRCDNSSFKNWIQNRSDVVSNATGIKCNGSSILTLSDEYFACYDYRRPVYVKDYLAGPLSGSLTAAFFLLLVVVGLVFTYTYRHTVQVLLYNTRFRLRLRRPENVECPFDAVVMYDADNDDVRQWADEQLRPRLLEFEPRLKLLVPDLDLGLGFDELNCIVDGVTQSRRTIVVVDEGSYDNPYVLYSFKFAYHHMTADDRLHDVLLVLTDRLDVKRLVSLENVDANFRAYLAAGKHLRMSDERFWKELNFFMPDVGDEAN